MEGKSRSLRAAWWVLAGSCTGLFVLMLDSTVVTLALPRIRDDLGASVDGLQWIQNAYLLTLAASVVTAGRLGDIRGRRRVFIAGMAIFAAGSLLAGSATSIELLVAGRVAQGIGGAALLSLSLALIAHAFPAELQPRALGIWTAVSAVALALGPLIGGLLIDAASWRWIFFINVPVAAVGIAILLLRGGESRDPAAPPRVDVAGVSLLSLGLFAVVFALVQADEWGPGSGRTLGLLAGGAAILVAFWKLEGRVASPLVDFTLFRNGPYLGASAAAFALVGSYWAVMYFEPQYLQSALGYSAIAAGALILPITAPMAFFSPFSGFLIGRFGARRTMTFGMLVALAGLVALALGQDSGSYGGLLPGFLGFGISLALVYAPMSTAAMAAMPAEKVGIAAGVLAMDRVLAGALLLAITAAVFQGALPAGADPTASAQFGSAVADALWPAIVVVAVGALLTWLLVRDPDHPAGTEGAHAHRHHRFHL